MRILDKVMKIPTHVAIILDGNRRWAKEKKLPTLEGHRRGLNRVIEIGKKARELGVKILTCWFFSTENFNRSPGEKNYLWKLFEIGAKQHLKVALREQIRIIHIGRKDRLPKKLIDIATDVEKKTKKFSKYYLVIAIDYGGKDDIIRGIKRIPSSKFEIRNIDIVRFKQFLDTKDLPQPDVDLVIRTGGELRTSGFLLWQAAYAEYIFIKKYMPDFTAKDFEECINEYSQRQRRFGK